MLLWVRLFQKSAWWIRPQIKQPMAYWPALGTSLDSSTETRQEFDEDDDIILIKKKQGRRGRERESSPNPCSLGLLRYFSRPNQLRQQAIVIAAISCPSIADFASYTFFSSNIFKSIKTWFNAFVIFNVSWLLELEALQFCECFLDLSKPNQMSLFEFLFY